MTRDLEKGTYIGLMSGTSLDGLDLVAVQFRKNGRTSLSFNILASETLPYNDEWHSRLGPSLFGGSAQQLVETHWAYGTWLGQQVKSFTDKNSLEKVVAVGSHGHTVFHRPDVGYTYQIGEGHAILEACGIPVITDFRSANVARGGQGAPLVPLGDQLLFGEYTACLNLGGFANLSYPHGTQGRIAYDIVPCNIVLNEFAQRMGFPFDEGGELAQSGQPLGSWLNELNHLPFYQEAPPKSLGVEWLKEHMGDFLDSQLLSQDLLATFTKHIAFQLFRALEPLAGMGNGEIMVTGGGAYNHYLIATTQSLLPSSLQLKIPSKQLIEYKEALVFALLAQRYMLGMPNCLASATGVAKDHTGGVGFGIKSR
ncbi:MAG TPA: anhydro-N-acetylmuramic acid kinase [Cytophagales bacterium]|nr:anhydro-N-acetylmuramic acid kinase [Cytophagales bacterium]